MAKGHWQFILPALARPTYDKLRGLMAKSGRSQWDLVTLGIHILDELMAKTPMVGLETAKQFVQRVFAESKKLKPTTPGANKTKAGDTQTKLENGENFEQ